MKWFRRSKCEAKRNLFLPSKVMYFIETEAMSSHDLGMDYLTTPVWYFSRSFDVITFYKNLFLASILLIFLSFLIYSSSFGTNIAYAIDLGLNNTCLPFIEHLPFSHVLDTSIEISSSCPLHTFMNLSSPPSHRMLHIIRFALTSSRDESSTQTRSPPILLIMSTMLHHSINYFKNNIINCIHY